MKNLLLVSFICMGFFIGDMCYAQKNQISQTDSIVKKAMTHLTEQIRRFPQEKIFLHLDKPYYSAGERIWLRAHMVHATLHIPMSISRYIYVELVNSENELVQKKKLHMQEKDLYIGQLDLSEKLSTGWYTIRAYTLFMGNVLEDYFFNRKIYIANLLNSKETKKIHTTSGSTLTDSPTKKTSKIEQPIDLQFFPEGGHLIAGNFQQVGFKAIGENGKSVHVNGIICDQKGNEVAKFTNSHLGMGSFILYTEENQTYTAEFTFSGKKHKVALPAVSKVNYGLAVQQTASRINIQVLTPNRQKPVEKLHLIATLRGLPVFQTTIDENEPGFVYPKLQLKSGMMQVYLINNKYQILSARNLFIIGHDFPEILFHSDKKNYEKRSPVNVTLELKEPSGKPIAGSFSISVTADNDVKIDSSSSNILSYLLLESDINGSIEAPGNYFLKSNALASSQLDALMLTQAWKRYDTQAALLGNYDKCDQFSIEQGPVVSGQVRQFPSRRALNNHQVSLFLYGKTLFFDATRTDKNGFFSFHCPNFPEGTKLRLEASKRDNENIELIIHEDTFPKMSFPEKADIPAIAYRVAYFEKATKKYNLENGIASIELNPVEVISKSKNKYDEIRKDHGILYKTPNQSLYEDDITGFPKISEALRLIPGATIAADGTSITMNGGSPLFLVDNIEYTLEELDKLNVQDVALIDVLKDNIETSLYGGKGNFGVICVYLKRGTDFVRETRELGMNQTILQPLGYVQPDAFYVPKYQYEANRLNPQPDLRTTIYWQPNVKTDANGIANIHFFTADETSSYTITAEGITSTGEIIHFTKSFNRK